MCSGRIVLSDDKFYLTKQINAFSFDFIVCLVMFIGSHKHPIIYRILHYKFINDRVLRVMVNCYCLLGAHMNALNNYHQSHVLWLIYILTLFN